MHRVTFLKSSSLIHVQWFSSGDIGFIVLLYCYFWQHNIRVRAFHKLSLSLFAFLLLSPLSFAVLKDVMLGAFALTESCRCCCFMFFFMFMPQCECSSGIPAGYFRNVCRALIVHVPPGGLNMALKLTKLSQLS